MNGAKVQLKKNRPKIYVMFKICKNGKSSAAINKLIGLPHLFLEAELLSSFFSSLLFSKLTVLFISF